MEPVIEPCSLAVFGPAGSQKALHGVYLLGVEGDRPMVRKVVKKDADSPGEKDRSSPASLSARVNARRKSFMTPTPLHMPDSRVSPI
ncbi:MAG: hypothetical protein GWN10_04640, partial [Nitrospinaceae bacterium]|nr:hypothetical protein [Nitrospinaceae bacterium]NIR54030.1 hypothetical protein [Nitrospinaceae bacterium]NIS84447.1 hypothetical protein [Nitrospinaceae bacterium]NIT81243.1 hypothetical protein [Nitrospinaceae bacterium]NIU43530.1 hypothetical protein [Nitrospinaceae bacterium]